eukprot:TRINITY_DN1132_c0_g1_i1.p1 TRINITY_DN1132_c0_g1~~TRINITY_DN1132_c0_g1_i1.p1  ORF type:complete len:233 (+),score=67.25 TRINITY_DN1132_c0_g1_i1:75-773(+)
MSIVATYERIVDSREDERNGFILSLCNQAMIFSTEGLEHLIAEGMVEVWGDFLEEFPSCEDLQVVPRMMDALTRIVDLATQESFGKDFYENDVSMVEELLEEIARFQESPVITSRAQLLHNRLMQREREESDDGEEEEVLQEDEEDYESDEEPELDRRPVAAIERRVHSFRIVESESESSDDSEAEAPRLSAPASLQFLPFGHASSPARQQLQIRQASLASPRSDSDSETRR